MYKLKILSKIFNENKNCDLITKLYLYYDYTSNLKKIKTTYNLTLLRTLFFPKIKIINYQFKKDNSNTKKQGLYSPDFKEEFNEINNLKRKKFYENLSNVYLKIYNKLNIKHFFDLKNTQNNVKLFFEFLSKHISNYKKSIQEIVEGQREVTQNKNFKFEDGQTVQEKMDNFDKKMKEYFNIQEFYKKIKNNNK